MGQPRHFLDLDQVSAAELRRILDIGHAYKNPGSARAKAVSAPHHPLAGKTLAMIFEKPQPAPAFRSRSR